MSTNTNCCQNGFGLGENYHGLVLSEKTKKRKRKRKEKIRERESEKERERERRRKREILRGFCQGQMVSLNGKDKSRNSF